MFEKHYSRDSIATTILLYHKVEYETERINLFSRIIFRFDNLIAAIDSLAVIIPHIGFLHPSPQYLPYMASYSYRS